MNIGAYRTSKSAWYAMGSFANPRCFRRADSSGAWRYFVCRE